MLPNIKPYPITQCIPSASGKPCLLPASSTSLAQVLFKPMSKYLKQVIRQLKNVFEVSPHILFMECSIEVHSVEGTCTLNGKLMVKQMCLKQTTMLDALIFLNLFSLHNDGFLTKVIQRLCKGSEINDEVVLAKLKKLKEHLITLADFLDKILVGYPLVEVTKNLPNVKKIKRVAKKLRKDIKMMNPQNISQLIPNIEVTEEHNILCSVLGLKSCVADRLKMLDPVVRNHQSDMYFLQHFLADQDVNSDVGECLRNIETVSLKLQEMGFTQSRSVAIADWIAEQPWAEHQSLVAWAQHYIEGLFTYDIFLNDFVSRYPYEEHQQDKWFSVPVERYDDDVVVKTEVKVINTTYSTAPQAINKIAQQHPGKSIYYHGTDHMSAKSILEDGINLGMGKSECDFSSGSGFYLVDRSKYATQWAMKSKAAAVLVYGISKGCLNDYQVLDLSNEREKWKEVREHFRNRKKLSRNTKQEYRNCDYIKGPIDSTPQSTQQICIRSEELAVHIGNATNICAVVFMNGQ